MKREKKPVSRDYLRIVEWSQEDRCFVGSAPPPVHQALALKARAAGKSLNSYCAERLVRLRS